jgi:hypothetical protein
MVHPGIVVSANTPQSLTPKTRMQLLLMYCGVNWASTKPRMRKSNAWRPEVCSAHNLFIRFIPEIQKVTKVLEISPTQSIWSMYYKFTPPVSPRVFTVLQITRLEDTPGNPKKGFDYCSVNSLS